MQIEELVEMLKKDSTISCKIELPLETLEDEEEVDSLVKNLLILQKQGYDIWRNLYIYITLNLNSISDYSKIENFFQKYNDFPICLKKETLVSILDNNFAKSYINLLRESNIIYYSDTLSDIDRKLLETLSIKNILIDKNNNRFSRPITIEKYKKILKISTSILKDLDANNDKLKLLQIEQRLATIVKADINEKDFKNNEGIMNRNLESLLQNKAVCNGFAMDLKQICSLAGIDCKMIASKSQEHSYNQVKVDGIWYNTDLTWNIQDNLAYGGMPQSFLLSDSSFIEKCNSEEREHHCTNNSEATLCKVDNPLSMEELVECTKKLNDWKNSELQLENNETILS